MIDHLARFPSEEEIEELCAVLRAATLREMSAELVKAGMSYARGETGRLEYARLLNSWIATAEETVAAGSNVKRISRRRKSNP